MQFPAAFNYMLLGVLDSQQYSTACILPGAFRIY
jgi:hypothetical protein